MNNIFLFMLTPYIMSLDLNFLVNPNFQTSNPRSKLLGSNYILASNTSINSVNHRVGLAFRNPSLVPTWLIFFKWTHVLLIGGLQGLKENTLCCVAILLIFFRISTIRLLKSHITSNIMCRHCQRQNKIWL